MRILLIKPPASVSFNAVTPPLGVMYLSSFLKQHGYKEVKIVHMDVEQMQVEGIKTTIPFHIKVMSNQYFLKGEVYTNFLQKRILPEKIEKKSH